MFSASYCRDIKALSMDLDDTIHKFRMASSSAAALVFEYINDHYGVHVETLRESYEGILKTAQAGHFAERKSSDEHRRERFTKLLEEFSILGLHDVDACLATYKEGLAQNLCLNPGAKECLKTAKRKGLITLVISEGPHDAQAWTLERLGISNLVDTLVTSGLTGIAKDQGLFALAASKTGVHPSQILHIGDNPERDVIAAQRDGLNTILYAPHPANSPDGLFSIQSLELLAEWLDRLTPPLKFSL